MLCSGLLLRDGEIGTRALGRETSENEDDNSEPENSVKRPALAVLMVPESTDDFMSTDPSAPTPSHMSKLPRPQRMKPPTSAARRTISAGSHFMRSTCSRRTDHDP